MSFSATVYDLISSTLKPSAPVICQHLIDHLGLSLISLNARRPTFSHDGKGLLDEFYRATTGKVNEIVQEPEYGTKRQLKQHAVRPTPKFLNDVTTQILSRFGSKIWNASSTHTTKSGSAPLEYEKREDREKIVAYVYCWIIARALRKLPPAKPRDTTDSKPEQSMPQYSTSIAARRFAPPNLIQGPTSPGSGSSRAVIQHQQPLSRPASRKRKRKRSNSIPEHERIAGPMTLRRLSNQPPYSPAIRRSSLSTNELYSSLQEAGSIFHRQSRNISDDNDSVMGPVNEDQAPQATSQALVKLAKQSKHSTLLFLDLKSYYDKPQTISQTRLASELLEMLESCDPGHQDTAMCKIVVLIKQIRETDKERLEGAYGINSERYRNTLTVWLEAMAKLVNIRRIMLGFKGDEEERAKPLLKSLSDEQYKSVVKKLCVATHKVNEMRSAGRFTDSKFSGDLARIFIALIEGDWMRQTYLEGQLTEFNTRLLAWLF